MSPLGKFPSTEPLTLLLGYESPLILAGCTVEPHLFPVVVVLNKVFLTVLTSVQIIFFFNTAPTSRAWAEAETSKSK